MYVEYDVFYRKVVSGLDINWYLYHKLYYEFGIGSFRWIFLPNVIGYFGTMLAEGIT